MDVIQLPLGIGAPTDSQEPTDNIIQLPDGLVGDLEELTNTLIQLSGTPVTEEELDEHPYDSIHIPDYMASEPTHIQEPCTYTFQLRRGLVAEWIEENPILRAGEPGYEYETGNIKVGNGVTPWTGLDYIPSESTLATIIAAALAGIDVTPGDAGDVQDNLDAHVVSLTPHPAYDEGPSFLLLYQNAKV